MERFEKRTKREKIYGTLAELYLGSRKSDFSHPYTIDELCVIAHALTGEDCNRETLRNYVKELEQEKIR